MEWFCRWGPQTTSQFLCFLADILVTFECWRCFHSSGSMRRSLQPTQVAQVVQLIQDGTSLRAVARRFAVSVSVEGNNPAVGPLLPPLCKEEHCHCLQQATNVHVSAQTVRNRLHEGGMRARRPQVGVVLTAQHRAGRLAFAREHQVWQIRHWRPVLFTDESRFTLSM
ncbi:unnamed protein product [Oncorhynchus mykiss]|uniref:Transposase Tc1-like domain-containing protein n=1 Tax=Oncorhynchus mykiss TaxID=8022 RepID=A0A060YF56_ONCMY|nr:unnamed protein product [Oncorhynchus mykiss]